MRGAGSRRSTMQRPRSAQRRGVALLLSALGLSAAPSCTYHTAQAPAECNTDAECDDGLACNGSEVCRNAACRPGDAAACPESAECFEHDTGPVCASAQESLWLVFVRGGALYGVNLAVDSSRTPLRLDVGLPPDRVVTPGSAAWSPDGKYLTFGTQGAGQARGDAGAGDAGGTRDAGTIDASSASEAGTRDAGTADGEAGATDAGVVPRAGAALYALDLSGASPGSLIRILDDNVPYAWAPDASALLVRDSTRALFLLKRTPTGFQPALQLTSSLTFASWEPSVPYRPTLALPLALWSPRSDQVAFLTDSFVSIIPADAGANPPSSRGIPAVQRDGYAWSPDGARLLVRRGNDLVLDGGTAGVVLASGADGPLWSPDSRYVAYRSGSTTAVALASKPSETLTAAPFRGEPCWSRDSSLLSVVASGTNVSFFDVSRRATQTLRYRYATPSERACWSPQEKYFPVLTTDGANYSFVVLDADDIRSGFGSDAGSGVTAVYQSPAITYQEIFISEFASNDSAVTFVTGPSAQQELTLVTLAGAAIKGRVIAKGQNLRAKFSATAGFLVYTSGEDSSEQSTTGRELHLVDLRDGKAREPQPIGAGETSGFLSDVSWQPARAAPPH